MEHHINAPKLLDEIHKEAIKYSMHTGRDVTRVYLGDNQFRQALAELDGQAIYSQYEMNQPQLKIYGLVIFRVMAEDHLFVG